MRTLIAVLALALSATAGPAVGAPAPSTSGAPAAAGGTTASAASTSAERRAPTRFRVRKPVTGLSHVWDVKVIGKSWLLTERDTARVYLFNRGKLRQVSFPSGRVWVSGETGLMSLAIDPRFAKNRRFYTCQGGNTASGHEVKVMAWRLSANGRKAINRGKLLGGFPTTSGRHGGCRLMISKATGAMYVGTGDAAEGTNPRNRRSLGGKVLRLNRRTGKPWPTNPFIGAANRKKRYVLTFGHRNVQGLAERRDGSVWSAEHGPSQDDEVNLLVAGGDYGWNPVPGYNESVPMTDQSLPGTQVEARWSSGSPTVATSGATWVYGAKWGNLNGTLAVAALKESRILFLRFDANGDFVRARAPQKLRQNGRIRSLTLAPNGDLLATTDNGSGDGVLRITPRSRPSTTLTIGGTSERLDTHAREEGTGQEGAREEGTRQEGTGQEDPGEEGTGQEGRCKEGAGGCSGAVRPHRRGSAAAAGRGGPRGPQGAGAVRRRSRRRGDRGAADRGEDRPGRRGAGGRGDHQQRVRPAAAEDRDRRRDRGDEAGQGRWGPGHRRHEGGL